MKRAALAGVLALGCHASPAPRISAPSLADLDTAPGEGPDVDLRAAAGLRWYELDEQFPRRAIVARRGAVRWSDGGSPIAVAALGDRGDRYQQQALAVSVLAERGAEVQVWASGDSADFALWVDRADLLPVVRTTTAITATDDATAGFGEIGGLVEVREAIGASATRVQVVLDCGVVTVTGWIARDAISRVAVSSVSASVMDAPEPTRWLAEGTELLDPATGTGVSTSVDTFPVTVGATTGDTVAITLTGACALHVAVPATALGAAPPDDGGYGMGGMGSSPAASLAVPRDACLFDRPGGQVIGAVHPVAANYSDATFPFEPAGDGWWAITTPSWWGQVTVYVGGGDPAAAPDDTDRERTGSWGQIPGTSVFPRGQFASCRGS